MVISKDFLNEKISEYREKANNESDNLKKNHYLGTVEGFQIAYAELTRPPKTKDEVAYERKMSVFDPNKIVKSVIDFYIGKGYTKDKAEELALKVVADQQQKRMNQFLTNNKLDTKCHECGQVQPSINLTCAKCNVKLDEFESILK